MVSNVHIIIISISCILSVFCGTISLGIALYTYLQWKAKELSTHNIQYVPMDPNWGSSDEEISEINNMMGSNDSDYGHSLGDL